MPETGYGYTALKPNTKAGPKPESKMQPPWCNICNKRVDWWTFTYEQPVQLTVACHEHQYIVIADRGHEREFIDKFKEEFLSGKRKLVIKDQAFTNWDTDAL